MKSKLVICCDNCSKEIHDNDNCYGYFDSEDEIYICQDCIDKFKDNIKSKIEQAIYTYSDPQNRPDISIDLNIIISGTTYKGHMGSFKVAKNSNSIVFILRDDVFVFDLNSLSKNDIDILYKYIDNIEIDHMFKKIRYDTLKANRDAFRMRKESALSESSISSSFDSKKYKIID